MAHQNRKPWAQRAYARGGFGEVWRTAKGHGWKRWYSAYRWAKGRADRLKDGKKFRDAAHVYERKYKHLRAKKHHHAHVDGRHVVLFDGKPCAAWIANINKDARESGIWNGTMLSGVRTSAESIALCQAMCGAPACPGRCAGVNSNHNCDVCKYPEGAEDVTDPAGLQAYCRSHHRPLKGDGVVLPSDINHFSHAGN